MHSLTPTRIAALLQPYYVDPTPLLLEQLSSYLGLLLKWNAHTNLTSIRDPESIVQRHFGESLFAAGHLPPFRTLLDLGSGAGFPGLPIQLAYVDHTVVLSESQNKKASFLREVVRNLGLSTEVWASRVQDMPATRTFDVVALRAVDNPEAALAEARRRLTDSGVIAHLSTTAFGAGIALPNSVDGVLRLKR